MSEPCLELSADLSGGSLVEGDENYSGLKHLSLLKSGERRQITVPWSSPTCGPRRTRGRDWAAQAPGT